MRWFPSRFLPIRPPAGRSLIRRTPRRSPQRRPTVRPFVEPLETLCLLSASLVADLNTQIGSAILLPEFTASNGAMFFLADDGIHGRELWKSDGTTAGTHLVKDINRGAGSAFNQFPADLTDVNGTLFFPANDGVHGYQVWRSDGTRAGTVMVTNINFGSGPGFPPTPYHLTNVDGTLFFSVSDAPSGDDVLGVWKSDGTPGGAVRLTNVPAAGDMVDVNGTLFFVGFEGGNLELWKSDGTPDGTVVLKRFRESERDLVNVNGTLFFAAAGDDGLQTLWKSDGTPDGTVSVGGTDLLGSYPENLTNVNGTLFFQAGTNGFHNRQLWKSDGTDAGTQIVQVINPSGDAFGFGAFHNSFAIVNGTLYVTANDGTGPGIWKSDGTPDGTVLDRYVSASELTVGDGNLFFNGSDPVLGTGLWKSDGTPDGTVLVKNLNEQPHGLTPAYVNGRLFFSAQDDTHDVEPWTSDGTADGTGILKAIFHGNQSSDPHNLVRLNNAVYFVATGDTGPRDLEEQRHRRRHHRGRVCGHHHQLGGAREAVLFLSGSSAVTDVSVSERRHPERHGQASGVWGARDGPDERRRNPLLHGRRAVV